MNIAVCSHYWTPEQDAQLTDGCAIGLSFSVIAEALGVTRNAAIGRAHRLGIQSPKKREGKPPRRVPHPLPRKPRTRIDESHISSVAKVLIPHGKHKRPPNMTPQQALPMPVESRRVLIYQLEQNMCRWPLWSHLWGQEECLGVEDKFYCGAATPSDHPYCEYHHAVGYQPPNPSHRGIANAGFVRRAPGTFKVKAA